MDLGSNPGKSPKSKWRKGMDNILILVGVVVAWVALTQWVLPKLGVPT
jgi:hypothetical protein